MLCIVAFAAKPAELFLSRLMADDRLLLFAQDYERDLLGELGRVIEMPGIIPQRHGALLGVCPSELKHHISQRPWLR